MITLSGLRLQELEDLTEQMGATKFRAKQIHNWIYAKSVSTIDEMTNLSKDFREELKSKAVVTESKIKVKQVSSDGTIKYLIEYPDGECVETVLMRFDNRANLNQMLKKISFFDEPAGITLSLYTPQLLYYTSKKACDYPLQTHPFYFWQYR